LGKLTLSASFFFKSALGIESAPDRAAVALLAQERLRQFDGPVPAGTARFVSGDFLAEPLDDIDVLFCHNLVFSRALARALEQKLDREVKPGAQAFFVNEMRYSTRARLRSTLAASYNWSADGSPRPLFKYEFVGE
jgi:hypothetical protein